MAPEQSAPDDVVAAEHRIRRLAADLDWSRAVDATYDVLDEMLLAGELDDARALLSRLDGLRLPILLSALTITLPWRTAMGEERRRLVEAVRHVAGERADDVLRGLE